MVGGEKLSTAEQFDVLIAGGGAIGAALAIELGNLGQRVALIEARAPSFSATDPERVIALSYGSRLHLQRLGVWERIAKPGAGAIRHIHVSEPGSRGSVELEAQEAAAMHAGAEALGYVVQMHHVLEPMYAGLPESVTLISPASVVAVTNGEREVAVRLAGAGAPRELRGRLLIGADGTESGLRRLAGIGVRGWEHNRFGLVASVVSEHPHGDFAYECFKPNGPLAFLPLADGRYSIVWSLAPREAADLMLKSDMEFIACLESAAGADIRGRLGRIVGIGKRACFPLELRVAERFALGRIALAGNAAHTLHPVAGQGMNIGLRDVAVLADVLAGHNDDPGRPILLQEYAERRRTDTLAVIGFTEGMLHSFEPDFFPAGWVRGRALSCLQLCGPVRQFLLRQASGIGQLAALRANRVSREEVSA